MNKTARMLTLWAPRVLGVGLSLFLAMFALDAIQEGPLALFMHLIPARTVLAIVGLSWRWEWIGSFCFLGLAILYAATTQRLDWIVTISGPLTVVALLFFWSWLHHEELHAPPA